MKRPHRDWLAFLVRPDRSIAWRLVGAMWLLVTIVFGVLVYSNDSQRTVRSQKLVEARRLAQIVDAIVVKEMLADEHWRVQDHLDLVEAVEEIDRIRVLRRDGSVRFTSDPGEVGAHFEPLVDSPCRGCHGTEDSPQQILMRRAESHPDAVIFSRLIENSQECMPCHSEDGDVVGKLVLDLRLSEHDASVLGGRNRLMASAGWLLGLCAIGVGGVVYVFVQRPVDRLIRAVHAVEAGDFRPKFPPSGRDEIGILSDAFQRMARRLGRLVEDQDLEIEERTRALRASHMRLIQSQKLSSIGTMTSGIAHEIGNPLSAISAVAELLPLETRDPVVAARSQEILDHVGRISRLVDDLTTVPRPVEGSDAESDSSVTEVIQSTLRVVRFDRRLKHEVHIEVQGVDADLRVAMPEEHLVQVLLNLVVNAGDAVADDGAIVIACTSERDGVTIRVRDDGHGISAEDLDAIFDPFFTTKSRERGTGLGLWVCHTLVERWGGSIRVESEAGVGTVVTVDLPSPGALHEVSEGAAT